MLLPASAMVRSVLVMAALVQLCRARISDPQLGFERNKVTGCPAEFQGACHCGVVPYGVDHVPTYVTNCTNAAFDDSTMLQHVPIETEVLIFVNNELYDLHFNIFGKESGLSQLHTVDLSNNHIQTIKGRTFHNVNNVTKLVLNDNDLYVVSKDFHPRMFSNFKSLEELQLRNAFSDKDVREKTDRYLSNLADTFKESGLVNLKALDLSENGFTDFKNASFFQSMPALETIALRSNKMSNLDVDLTLMPRLKSLDLSNNNFPFLRRATLSRISAVAGLGLNLSGNPLRCDCRMLDTYHYLLKSTGSVADKEEWRCYEANPSENVGKSLFEIDPRDLQCELKADPPAAHDLHVSYIVLGLVGVIFGVILAVVVFRHRRQVQSLALRVSEPVRNKFNYSSLDKKDIEAEMEV